jgi:bifunctional UDP-N-acetylglucosamine pyrophosphorylase / glucosamine-1-phosphate N-acetyltransferase
MESQPLAVVVLAAGLGKRMVSQQPKVLHRLAGLPLVSHVLRAVAPLYPSRTLLVTGHGSDEVRAALGDGYGPDNQLSLEYALQPEQLGTGHAVLMAEPILRDHGGPVLVMYGDTPLLRTETLSSLLGRHRQAGAFLTILTCIASDPTGYGRVLRDQNQSLLGVVEESAATLVQRAISEVNSGVYLFDSEWLWPHLEQIEINAQGEYYLTDLVAMAIEEERMRRPTRPEAPRRGASGVMTFTLEGLDEAMGINSRAQLAQAEQIVQGRLRQKWMESGVTMLLPETVYLGVDVQVGADTVLYPGVILEGRTRVGSGCLLGPNTHIVDSTVGEDCRVVASMVEQSELERGVTMGPYSHLRANTHLGEGVHLGNFAEVKASTLESGVHMGHFSYVGDSTVGEETNIGAGTVTVNFDGEKKHRTTIGKRAFIGSGTMLRAPVEVGDGASTGAGSVVLEDVPPNTVVAGVPARVIRQDDKANRKSKPKTGDSVLVDH